MTDPTANKRKGAKFEIDVVKYLRAQGYEAERLRLSGSLDEGDVVLKVGGQPYVLELKDRGKLSLGPWVREAQVEALNYAKARRIAPVNYAAVAKRRSHGIDQSFVIVELREWLNQIDDRPF